MTSIACGVMFCTLLAGPLLAQPARHARHQGRIGGAFATAAADSLHVEAVWSEQRRVRLFVTEASGELLPLEVLRNISAIAIADGTESPAVLIEQDGHFEARIATLRLPATIDVRFKASTQAPEERLEFTFEAYSPRIDDVPRASPSDLPSTFAGLRQALEEDRAVILAVYAEHVDVGRLFPVEERIRERAMAIEPYLVPLPGEARARAQSAITVVVRSSWLFHMAMDHGNDAQIAAAVTQLTDALTRLQAAVSSLTP